jgi:surface polysaccharide O-acyltransferase-like enzyme
MQLSRNNILSNVQDKSTLRLVDLDFLRVIGAFAVVWLHVSGDVLVDTSRGFDVSWWVGNLANSMSRWGVPIFVMVSGALFLSRPIEESPWNFYRRRMIRLAIPLLVWTSFYTLITLRSSLNHDGMLVRNDLVINIMKGFPIGGFHLWYLYMCVGLYTLAPLVRFILDGMPQKWKVPMILITFIIASLESTTRLSIGTGAASTFLCLCLPYLPYFAMGYVMRKHSVDRRYHFWALLLVAVASGVLIAVLTAVLFPWVGKLSWMVLHGGLSPFVIVMTLCVYRAVIMVGWSRLSNKNVKVIVKHIAQVTLGIYVIHPFCLMALARFGLCARFINPVVGIPLTTIAAFTMALVMSRIIAIVPYVRKTVV